MKLELFIQNVRSWATVRGIYAQSSEEKQVEKFWEENREYLCSITVCQVMDGIGDMAATIVNAAWLKDHDELTGIESFPNNYCGDIAGVCRAVNVGQYIDALLQLRSLAEYRGVTLEKSLQFAWDEIKDIKGLMIDGLYVKWDNLNEEQREEFNVNLLKHIESNC